MQNICFGADTKNLTSECLQEEGFCPRKGRLLMKRSIPIITSRPHRASLIMVKCSFVHGQILASVFFRQTIYIHIVKIP